MCKTCCTWWHMISGDLETSSSVARLAMAETRNEMSIFLASLLIILQRGNLA